MYDSWMNKPNEYNSESQIEQRRQRQQMDAEQLANFQITRVNELIAGILPQNAFYASKLGQFQFPLESLEAFSQLPFTFKHELAGDNSTDGFANNLTFPVDHYTRLHRTSGTRGRPMVVLDTNQDWDWWIGAWQYVLDAAEIDASDRVVMAFSFGPFIGFWSAFEAVIARGALATPAGGMNTIARLELIRSNKATAIFCTPSYALHMAEVARENQINVSDSPVRVIVVAGEPGGSLPAVRDQIESFWNAKVIDHSGASEVGPWGFSDPLQRGVYVNEADFIAEFLSINSGEPADEGELAELVLTSLGRQGCPVIRYRTGDLVRPTWNDDQESRFVLLQGGVLGRTDDMMIIRGVNIFPSSIEQILRSFPEVLEFRLTAYKRGSMDEIKVEVEDRLNDPKRIVDELQLRLGLRVDVETVEIGSLPRYELKGNRFIDNRNQIQSE